MFKFDQETVKEIISSYAVDGERIGLSKSIYWNDDYTGRQVHIFDISIYHKIISNEDENNFNIYPYFCKEERYPQEEKNQSYDLFIPLPPKFDRSQCWNYLNKLFKELSNYFIIPGDSYKITIPKDFKTDGNHKGAAFVKFKESVSRDDIVISKEIIHNYSWNSCGDIISDDYDETLIHCKWCDITRKSNSNSNSIKKNIKTKTKKPVAWSESANDVIWPAIRIKAGKNPKKESKSPTISFGSFSEEELSNMSLQCDPVVIINDKVTNNKGKKPICNNITIDQLMKM